MEARVASRIDRFTVASKYEVWLDIGTNLCRFFLFKLSEVNTR